MPRGAYLHLDLHDGTPLAVEEFACAAGPAGWRYVGDVLAPADREPLGRVEVVCGSTWRQARVQLTGGGWLVRGGVHGREVLWLRVPENSGQPSIGATGERAEAGSALWGRSPAFAVSVARLLALTPGQSARVRVVAVQEPSLATRVVEHGWTLSGVTEHATDSVPLPVEAYEITDLSSGERAEVHLAGDVVVAGPGLELTALEEPPTLG